MATARQHPGWGVNNVIQGYGSIPAQAQSSINASMASGGRGGIGLPLHIVHTIISHMQDLGDVARFARTSHLMRLMSLRKLYENVSLHSYLGVRRINGRVEGLGAGSPITMALSSLATSEAADVVKKFALEGEWEEGEEYMLGRIPDSTVLLSIATRAAFDRMEKLQAFTWHLEAKPMRTIYRGLQNKITLTHFTISFPTTRTPKPIIMIPPIPTLKCFRVSNLDPLCYNDDISLLLYESKKIEELNMHWNPRMRLEAECSANLTTYFAKCIGAGYMMPLKKVGFQNYYGPNNGQFVAVLPQHSITSSHFLDMFGGAHGRRSNVFVDETWRTIPPVLNFKWKVHRSNELAIQHTRILRGFKGLEELYLISKTVGIPTSPRPASEPPMQQGASPSPSVGTPKSTASSGIQSSITAASNTPGYLPGSDLVNLGNEYLDAILTQHGPTLRHLLLFNRFGYRASQLDEIAASAPGLTQLGLALDGGDDPTGTDIFRHLIPRFPNLRVLRILENEFFYATIMDGNEEENLSRLCDEVARQIYACKQENLRWVGIGERVFEVSGETVEVDVGTDEKEWRVPLKPVPYECVDHISIWKMDSLVL